MYGIVQNKNHITIFRFYGDPLLFLDYVVYKTQEDFEENINGIQKTTPIIDSSSVPLGGKYFIYESAYGISVKNENSEDIRIILDNNPEKQALEDRMRDAVLADFNGGIIVPYSDLFKFSVEVVNAETGETIDILQGNEGNTWMRRSNLTVMYTPSSGLLAGKPCMRLQHSEGSVNIISKENKETGANNRSATLGTQRPYTIFISGLQVPHLEYSINSLFIDSEDYSKTYYYTFT